MAAASDGDRIVPRAAPDSIDVSGTAAGKRLTFLLDCALSERLGEFNNGITSAAFVDMLHIIPKLGDAGDLRSYTVEDVDGTEEMPRYRIRFNTEKRAVTAWISMAVVRNEWKIAAVKIPGIRD